MQFVSALVCSAWKCLQLKTESKQTCSCVRLHLWQFHFGIAFNFHFSNRTELKKKCFRCDVIKLLQHTFFFLFVAVYIKLFLLIQQVCSITSVVTFIPPKNVQIHVQQKSHRNTLKKQIDTFTDVTEWFSRMHEAERGHVTSTIDSWVTFTFI